MADITEATSSSPADLLALGRRHLAVRDYVGAVESLAASCELLAKEHGEMADECAEAYLWYGKALLGLSREENGVLGDGVPGSNEDGGNEEGDDDNNDEEDENTEDDTNEVEEKNSDVEGEKMEQTDSVVVEETKKDEDGTSSDTVIDTDGTSNGDTQDDSSQVDEDDVDNLQLAWEMLDLSRSILERRADSVKPLLAEVHLTLGEVAIESETYDKAVIDMFKCLEIQKELYKNDDRRIAETHYQIGLANSLASNFEESITHFKNAANIIQSRIKTLENSSAASTDATVKKYSLADPTYSVESEIKELKELLPEIQMKIQDTLDYQTETMERVRKALSSTKIAATLSNGASSSSSSSKPAASNISHLIKRKRKPEEAEDAPAPKKVST
ncbi:nuclear autoantigenic sperm protein [Leptidea sinapis]|uniref:nuclear autoantigenic sperm protein n=1 Tax=Leptidea sinapis TaxID=189913 RepID=UPI002131C487|nr:nuclear autoantigenic sperm protein [Leptidea sinapis]